MPIAQPAVRARIKPRPALPATISSATPRPEYATHVEARTIGLRIGDASMKARPAAGCMPFGNQPPGDGNGTALTYGECKTTEGGSRQLDGQWKPGDPAEPRSAARRPR